MSFARTWMELEDIIVSKINQTQNINGHVFSCVEVREKKLGDKRWCRGFHENQREFSRLEKGTRGGREEEIMENDLGQIMCACMNM